MDGVTPLQGMDLVIGGNDQKSTHYEIAGKPMEVSVNMGSPKWMVSNPTEMDDNWGLPPFQKTSM